MNTSSSAQNSSRPWWRFGHVWLVIIGPAVVVVAGFFTFYLAARAPDPVLPTHGPKLSAPGEEISQAPAVQARNHAATGTLPAESPKKP